MALVAVNMVVDVEDTDWLQGQMSQVVTAMRTDGDRIYDATMVVLKGDGERINLQES